MSEGSLDHLQLVPMSKAAALLAMKPYTLRRRVKANMGPQAVRIGRRLYFRLKDLGEWLDAHMLVDKAEWD